MNRTEPKLDAGAKKRFALNDKTNLRILRQAIEENLAEIAAELGIEIKTGSISYEGDGTACKVQLKVVAPDETGAIVPQYEKDFAKCWRLFAHDGLREEHLHATIVSRGEEFELVGLMPNRSKFPIVVKNKKTEKVVLMTTVVLRQLAKPAGAANGEAL